MASILGICQNFDMAALHHYEARYQAKMIELATQMDNSRIVDRLLGRGGFGDCYVGSILPGWFVVTK